MPPQSYQHPPPQGYYYPPPKPRKKSSNKPQVVAAMLAIVAVLGLISSSFGLVGFSIMRDAGDGFFTGDGSGTATVMGRATYLNGTGIEGVQIQIVGEAIGTVTDTDGFYLLYSVPTGDQRIQASKDGFTTIIRKKTVGEDMGSEWGNGDMMNKDVDFTMTPGTGTIETGRFVSDDIEIFADFVYACAAISLIASILAGIGAFYAYKRTNLSMVVVGSVAGIFTFGFFIGSVLGFIALFILLLSLDEFRTKDEEED
jgi:hypothetical protein